MKPGIPWSVKGVEPELREVAKTAARRSGMTLGEWLNSAINEQADEIAPAAAPVKASRNRISSHPIERAATRLEDIAEQLSILARRESETRQHVPPPAAEDSFAFSKVVNRIESNERQTIEAFSAVNERLATLSRQFTQAPKPATRAEDSAGFQTLEKAVRNIVEHLEVSDKRTRDNLKSLQDRMSDMATRAGGANSDQVLRQAPAFSQLENRLSELARRVDHSQQQGSTDLPEVLRRELDGLAGRIETVRDAAESLAAKAQTQAVQASQEELRVIEQRIVGLLREAQTSIATNSTNPAEIQRFRSEIDRLNSRIDEASQNAASSRDVTALRSAVEQLSTRVAQGPDMRPIADMDRRILEISQRLEQSHSAARDMPQFDELERRMVELDHRLNDAIRLQGDGTARVELEHKLEEVNVRLGRTEHQLTHLQTIENAIGQLYDSIEQNRNWTKEMAEDAANRMGQHILSQQQGPVNLAGSPEIMALEQGLLAVREASQTADSRNQETLEAVHETLEQIVSKLAELETAAIGQRVAHAAHPAPLLNNSNTNGSASPEASFEAPPELIVSADMDEAPELANVFEQAPGAEAPLNPFDAANAPVQNPFELPPVALSTLAGDDFIAAARRAAQAATQQKGLLGNKSPALARDSNGKSKKLLSFKMPFSKKSKPSKAQPLAGDVKLPPQIKPANSNVAGNRRTLVLSGILVLSLFAFFIGKNVMGNVGQSLPPATPTTIEQPADQVPAPVAAPVSELVPVAPTLPQAAPSDQSSEADSLGVDEILTGALPVAVAPPDASTSQVALDDKIGPQQLRDAAQSGDANAQFVVATRYMNGENVNADFAKAAYWYGKAAASGLAPAQYRVATLYERGKGVPKNMGAALSWYERAAALGNVRAMHNAAVIAAGNEAGAPDYARAYKWFSLAADHGLKDSEFNLAVLIERGLGVKADPVEALFWYQAAASQQDADAKSHAETLAKTLSPATVETVTNHFKTWTPSKAPDNANVVAIDENAWKVGATQLQMSSAGGEDLVDKAQTLLDKLGYSIGQADGKLSGKTVNAIRLFQLQEGLKVTGEVSPELISALQSKAS